MRYIAILLLALLSFSAQARTTSAGLISCFESAACGNASEIRDFGFEHIMASVQIQLADTWTVNVHVREGNDNSSDWLVSWDVARILRSGGGATYYQYYLVNGQATSLGTCRNPAHSGDQNDN